MTQMVAWLCDAVLDEFGSTCPTPFSVIASSIPDARLIAAQHGWTLAGSEGRDLCPTHSGRLYRLHLDPPDNVQPLRRPEQVASPLLDNVTPLRSRSTPDPDQPA